MIKRMREKAALFSGSTLMMVLFFTIRIEAYATERIGGPVPVPGKQEQMGMYWPILVPSIISIVLMLVVLSKKMQNCFELPKRLQGMEEGERYKRLVHLDDREKVEELFCKIKQGAEEVSADIRVRMGDDFHWESFRLTSIYTKKGRRIKVIGTAMDIDIQKRAELEYAEQLQYISEIGDDNILEKALINISKNKIEFICDRHNKSIVDVKNLKYEECMNRYTLQAENETEKKKLQKTFNRMKLLRDFQRGETFTTLEYRRKTAGGDIRVVAANCRVFIKPDTGDYMCFVYAIDVSKQVLEKNIVQRITNVEYDFLSILDVKKGIIFSHNRKEGMTERVPVKYHEYELDREYIFHKVLEPSDVEEVLKKTSIAYIVEQLEQQNTYMFTVNMIDGDGNRKRKKLQYCYLDENRDKILLSQSDVTEIYQQEQRQLKKVEQALETAEQAVLAKTEFMSRMSHDIRTPMNGIIGMTQLALEEEMSEEVRSCLLKIENASNFLLSLINDILDLAKIESGKIQLKQELVRGDDFFQSVIDIVKPIAEKKDIILTCDFSGRKTKWALLDRMRCQQVMINLLNNAVKFSEKDSQISWTVTEYLVEGNRYLVETRIQDQGCGMSKEFLPHIFKPFQQENNSCNNRHAGTGLGLAIVKNLVEQMNGTIEVESELGVGSTFIVKVVMECGREDVEIHQTPQMSRNEYQNLREKHILLCEDHPLNTEIAKRILEKKGILVDCAENGAIAVSLFEASKEDYYDAVLMDIRMPVLDGIEATKRIRKLERRDASIVPIIAMTANAFDEDRENTKKAGMNAHLAKPVEPKLLFDTLERVWKGEK